MFRVGAVYPTEAVPLWSKFLECRESQP